ncbi:MAG: hypothetical protein K9W44_16810 [Candidatus Lokiarchaeota archaeon]|nr:hypothetical protein [Candidatus Harpocratesius repetitus]
MKEAEIKILLEIKENLIHIIQTKTADLEKIKQEIDNINSQVEKINQLISSGSFITAANLIDAEAAAKKKISITSNTEMVKKIFSSDKSLLADLKYSNYTVKIRFPDPKKVNFSQELYITKFVKPILVPLKKKEPSLQSQISKLEIDNELFISSIILQNVNQFDSFSSIYESLIDLLRKNV